MADTLREIDAAVGSEPTAPPALPGGSPGTFATGAEGVALPGEHTTLGLPTRGIGTTVGGTTVFDAAGTGKAQVAVQAVPVGTRALVNIDGPEAPERYEFPVSGDVARLRRNRDGSVAAFDAKDKLVGGFAAPWARDANGKPVATRYEVSGTTLIQHVYHREATVEYGVTADPFWVGLAVRWCMRTRCYRWMPNWVANRLRYGHISPAVIYWLKRIVCRRTRIC